MFRSVDTKLMCKFGEKADGYDILARMYACYLPTPQGDINPPPTEDNTTILNAKTSQNKSTLKPFVLQDPYCHNTS